MSTQQPQPSSSKAVGRISSAEGRSVVRGARTGTFVPSRSSSVETKVGKLRRG